MIKVKNLLYKLFFTFLFLKVSMIYSQEYNYGFSMLERKDFTVPVVHFSQKKLTKDGRQTVSHEMITNKFIKALLTSKNDKIDKIKETYLAPFLAKFGIDDLNDFKEYFVRYYNKSEDFESPFIDPNAVFSVLEINEYFNYKNLKKKSSVVNLVYICNQKSNHQYLNNFMGFLNSVNQKYKLEESEKLNKELAQIRDLPLPDAIIERERAYDDFLKSKVPTKSIEKALRQNVLRELKQQRDQLRAKRLKYKKSNDQIKEIILDAKKHADRMRLSPEKTIEYIRDATELENEKIKELNLEKIRLCKEIKQNIQEQANIVEKNFDHLNRKLSAVIDNTNLKIEFSQPKIQGEKDNIIKKCDRYIEETSIYMRDTSSFFLGCCKDF